jgi:DmsE family decaheme c-type cytochrome
MFSSRLRSGMIRFGCIQGDGKMTMLRKWLRALACAAAVTGAGGALADAAKPATTTPVTPKAIQESMQSGVARAVLGASCISCHKEIKGTTARPEHYHGNCETCHAGGDAHRQSIAKGESGIGSIANPQSAECRTCHKNDRKLMNWAFSVHSKAGGNCSDCHAVHASPVTRNTSVATPKVDQNSAVCIKCHLDTNSQFRMRSHHPVLEGAMGCTGCHNPHGSDQTALVSKSDQCLSCHQQYRGPMVFQHAPVVEDCTSCHAPHGSPNRGLLSVSQPAVCLQCHSIAGGKHGYGTGPEPAPKAGTRTISGTVLRSCTSCHGAIHGSQQDPLLRY